MNLLAGLGVHGRDKVMSQTAIYNLITFDMRTLEALYRSDWLSRKIVDIPAFDATRAWRSWEAEQDQIEALEETERSFALKKKMLEAMTKARLYGGSAMLMGIKGQKFTDELDLDSIKKGDLVFIHVVEKWMMQAGPRVRDITSPWFGEPEWYMRSNIPIVGAPGGVQQIESSSLGYKPGETIFIHPSRVVRLVGLDYPDIEHAPDVWGDSVLQPVHDAIRDAGLVSQSLANCVSNSKVDVYRIPGLTATLSTQIGTNKMLEYLSAANVAKSTVNSLVLDKEIEWERIQTKFEGMPQVLQAYLLIAAAAADIPSTRLLSREPSGRNATGESDIRNYYDRLHADQEVRITPALTRLDEVLIRSSLGRRDPDVYYTWNSLWQMSDTEKADVALKKAQAYKIDVDASIIAPEVLKIGRENQLVEDGLYPGLESAIDDEQALQEAAEDLDEAHERKGKRLTSSTPAEPDSDADGSPNAQPNEKTTDDLGAGGGGSVGGQGALGFSVMGRGTPQWRRRHVKRRMKKLKARARDAKPAPLYVYRSLLNAAEIKRWARKQGFKTMIGDPPCVPRLASGAMSIRLRRGSSRTPGAKVFATAMAGRSSRPQARNHRRWDAPLTDEANTSYA